MESMIRELYFSDEFWAFYHKQQDKVITTKFVKHLENTDLYEMRISVGSNEYRTVLFAVDHDNIILATKIFVLNAFLKKSEKDYRKQIEIAENILGGFVK